MVKYGGPIISDDNVTAAVEAGEVVVDIIRGTAISFNTTFWSKILGREASGKSWALQMQVIPVQAIVSPWRILFIIRKESQIFWLGRLKL